MYWELFTQSTNSPTHRTWVISVAKCAVFTWTRNGESVLREITARKSSFVNKDLDLLDNVAFRNFARCRFLVVRGDELMFVARSRKQVRNSNLDCVEILCNTNRGGSRLLRIFPYKGSVPLQSWARESDKYTVDFD